MRDQHDDEMYQALRHDFADNISAIFKATVYALNRLHAQLYDAPWSRQAKLDCCPGRPTIV